MRSPCRCSSRSTASSGSPAPAASSAAVSRTSVPAVRADQRQVRGARGRHAGQPGDGGVDGVLGHDPVGRVLAAGDQHQPGHRRDDGVLAGQPAGLVRLPRQQRPQPGVDAEDLVGGHRPGEHPVDLVEQVGDVGAAGGRVVAVEPPRGVGGADDPVLAPRDDEQHAGRGPQDQAGRVPPAPPSRAPSIADRGTTRCTPLEARTRRSGAGVAQHRADVVAPHAGRGDDAAGADRERRSRRSGRPPARRRPRGSRVPRPRRAAARRPGRWRAPGRRSRPRCGRRPGCAGRRRPARPSSGSPRGRRRRAARGTPRASPSGTGAGAAGSPRPRREGGTQHVVEGDAGAEVGPLPHRRGERQQERQRRHQVRGDGLHQPGPLAQRLVDQRERQLLEVAQAAVDQLARPAGGARRQVAGLQQRHGQAAAGGVQRGAGAGDARRR